MPLGLGLVGLAVVQNARGSVKSGLSVTVAFCDGGRAVGTV